MVVTEYSHFESSEILDTTLPALNRSGGDLLVLADTVDHAGHPLIDPGLIARELAQGQRAEWLDQEYRCGFVVGLVASIFGDLPTKCEQEGRICDLSRQPDLPTLVGFSRCSQ